MEKSDFLPDVERLRNLVSEINSHLEQYESNKDPAAQASALQSMSKAAGKLKSATKDPQHAFIDFSYQPLANACTRIALSLGIFKQLSSKDGPLSVEEIARRTQADPLLVNRVIRALVACDIIEQDEDGRCSHSPMSRIYANESRASWTILMWEVMVRTSTRIGSFFSKGKFVNPTDPMNSPFIWAHDEKDLDPVVIMQRHGYIPLMNDAMAGSSVMCAKEAVKSYNFGELVAEDDGVVIVDVGGAKGDSLREIKRSFPSLKGRLILEELPQVLEAGAIQDEDFETQAYDFFKEEQPVKGAAAYYYQRVFHDWGDEKCGKILSSLRPAMSPQSKLLICDVVVPDQHPSSRKVLRDINMLMIAGKERSQHEWEALLERHGFIVEKFIGLENPDNSIIEAKLR